MQENRTGVNLILGARMSESSRKVRWLLILLFIVNLLNFIDRQVIYAVFPLIKKDLMLSDTALGLLGSSFMICFMFSALLFGIFEYRFSRTKMAAGALVLWSLATLGAGLSSGYHSLLAMRSFVGAGEAVFGTVSPGLIAESFGRNIRSRVLSFFFLAGPLGSALGYLLGGMLGQRFGWHAAFLIVGLPGLALALPLWRLSDPLQRKDIAAHGPAKSLMAPEIRTLFTNWSFVLITLAMAAMTFAVGGLVQWLPTFLYRMHGLSVAKGSAIIGGITVLAGIGGTLAGGYLGDRCQKKSSRGYLSVSAWGFLLSVPALACSLMTQVLPLGLATLLMAECFIFLCMGPLSTLIVNVTKPQLRTAAFALNLFFIRALGDAASPTILGSLSDIFDLRKALLVTPFCLLLAALLCFAAGRFITTDLREHDMD
jgi:predicted MFS family arabinose efflux permease